MLVSKKLIFTQKYEKVKPLFLKKKSIVDNKEVKNKIHIVGTQTDSFMMPNPDLENDADRQFDFVNNFTSTRIKQFERALVIESYINDPWVKVGGIPEFKILKDRNRFLRLKLLNNSILQAMNSMVLNISDFMGSKIV